MGIVLRKVNPQILVDGEIEGSLAVVQLQDRLTEHSLLGLEGMKGNDEGLLNEAVELAGIDLPRSRS